MRKLPSRYMYYPAMTFPHKNHLRLFEAMALLRERKGLRLNLICTGRAYKPFHPTLVEAVKQHGLERQVRFLGTVPGRAAGGLLPARQTSSCSRRCSRAIRSRCLRRSIIASRSSRRSNPPCRRPSGIGGYLFDALDVEAIAAALGAAWTDSDAPRTAAANARASFERYRWDRALVTLTACYKHAAGVPCRPEERTALDRALLEEKPEDA